MAYIFMAYIYIVMAYIVMACILRTSSRRIVTVVIAMPSSAIIRYSSFAMILNLRYN